MIEGWTLCRYGQKLLPLRTSSAITPWLIITAKGNRWVRPTMQRRSYMFEVYDETTRRRPELRQ
jgi:hypothetical protein